MADDTSADVELIQATPNDLEALILLVQAYFEFDNLTFSPAVRQAVAELLSSPELGYYFLIRLAGETVGYAALTYGFDAEAGGRIGIITDLYLTESARGRGAGRAALRHLLTFGAKNGLREIDLVVIDGNKRAETLYRSEGFVRTSGRFWMSRVSTSINKDATLS